MYFMPDLIEKKKRGLNLSKDEIDFIIEGYTGGDIPDYQVAALLMAVCFRGMDEEETTDLTMAMARSGDTVDLSAIEGIKVDKHSTGGIADTTTLVLLPLVASAGVKVAKMSGRGLCHTGGTVDKLESIPGFCAELSSEEFTDAVNRVGGAITGQSQGLVPADKLLYALRDVTATVDSIPLIASSIMSKKIAGGADKIVLDVKCGGGAFMKEYKDALTLGKLMVKIGYFAGKETIAYVTDMEQPLGLAIGNSLEVMEAIEILQGLGHEDLRELCIVFGAEMMLMAGIGTDLSAAENLLKERIASGAAFRKLKEIVNNQGGDSKALEHLSRFPAAPVVKDVFVNKKGYISKLDALGLGLTAMKLGAGRHKKGDIIDLGVGIWLKGKIGYRVIPGEPLARIYAKTEEDAAFAEREILRAVEISDSPVNKRKLIMARIAADGIREY